MEQIMQVEQQAPPASEPYRWQPKGSVKIEHRLGVCFVETKEVQTASGPRASYW